MTEADQRTAFLRAICENPKDDAPRLMFADRLDEHGEPERAEFIRVGCELAKMRRGPSGQVPENSPWLLTSSRYRQLRGRERELLEAHGSTWAAAVVPLPVVKVNRHEHLDGSLDFFPVFNDASDMTVRFRRGFVAAVTLPADAWLRHADALTVSCPLEKVRLTTELEFGRDWGFVDSDMCIAYLLTVEPHTEIDVTELPEGSNLIAALLAKRWPRITFHLPEDCR